MVGDRRASRASRRTWPDPHGSDGHTFDGAEPYMDDLGGSGAVQLVQSDTGPVLVSASVRVAAAHRELLARPPVLPGRPPSRIRRSDVREPSANPKLARRFSTASITAAGLTLTGDSLLHVAPHTVCQGGRQGGQAVPRPVG